MHYFSIFFKKFSNALIFRGFGRKTQIVEKILKIFNETSIEKLIYYFYFGKFVTNNRALGNNTIFTTICSVSGGDFPLPPWLRPSNMATLFWNEKMFGVKKGLTKKKFDFLLQCQTSQTFFTSNYFRYTVLNQPGLPTFRLSFLNNRIIRI